MKKFFKFFAIIFIFLCVPLCLAACGDAESKEQRTYYTFGEKPEGVLSIEFGDGYSSSVVSDDNGTYKLTGSAQKISVRLNNGYYLKENDDEVKMKLLINNVGYELNPFGTDESLFLTNTFTMPEEKLEIKFDGAPYCYKSDLKFGYDSSDYFSSYQIKYNPHDFDPEADDGIIGANLYTFLTNVIGQHSETKTLTDIKFGTEIKLELFSTYRTMPSSIISVTNDGMIPVGPTNPSVIAQYYENVNLNDGHLFISIIAAKDDTKITFNDGGEFDQTSSNYYVSTSCTENGMFIGETTGNMSVSTDIRLIRTMLNNFDHYRSAYYNHMLVKVNDVVLERSSTELANSSEYLNKFYIYESGYVDIVVSRPVFYIIPQTDEGPLTTYMTYSTMCKEFSIDFVFEDGDNYVSLADKLVEDGLAKKIDFRSIWYSEENDFSGFIPSLLPNIETGGYYRVEGATGEYADVNGKLILESEINKIVGEACYMFSHNETYYEVRKSGNEYKLYLGTSPTIVGRAVPYKTNSMAIFEIDGYPGSGSEICYYLATEDLYLELQPSAGAILGQIKINYNNNQVKTYLTSEITAVDPSEDVSVVKYNLNELDCIYQIRIKSGTKLNKIILNGN